MADDRGFDCGQTGGGRRATSRGHSDADGLVQLGESIQAFYNRS